MLASQVDIWMPDYPRLSIPLVYLDQTIRGTGPNYISQLGHIAHPACENVHAFW